MKKYFQAPWSTQDILIVFSATAVLIVGTVLGMELLDVRTYIEASPYRTFYLLGIFLLQWILILIPLLVLTLIKYKFKKEYFGFKKTGAWKIFKLVASGYLLFVGISFIITLIILYTGLKIPGYQLQEKVLPIFGDGLVSIIIAGIIIVLVAPPLEEIFFRGFLLRSLTNRVGIMYGSIFSAGIFAVFHMQWQSIIPIFILGLIINSLVLKSKSIWPAIYFHVFNNAIAFTFEVLIIKEVVPLETVV